MITGQYINYNGQVFFVVNYDLDHFYITIGDGFYKIDKTTGEEELLVDQIISSRATGTDYIVLHENNGQVDATYFDFDDRKSYTYSTGYPLGINYRLTGFGTVPSGVHFVIYEFDSDNGVIAKINPVNFNEIDSVFNVSFRNRPVASDEDIYYTHENPEVGNELFLIDYEVSNTKEIDPLTSIKILPNPANDFVKVMHPVDFNPLSISIFDIQGNMMLKNIKQPNIDIRDLASGIYVLHSIYTNGESLAVKFIVE